MHVSLTYQTPFALLNEILRKLEHFHWKSIFIKYLFCLFVRIFQLPVIHFSLEAFHIHKILKGKTFKRNYHQWKAKAPQAFIWMAALQEYILRKEKKTHSKQQRSKPNIGGKRFWWQTIPFSLSPLLKVVLKENRNLGEAWDSESDCDTSYCLIVLAVRPSTLALQCHYRSVYILTFNEALGHDRTPL